MEGIKMRAVIQTIRILVVILLIKNISCQDGYSERDILRLQHMASNEGQIETITSYSTNIMQRDPSSQSISSVSLQYQMTDDSDKGGDYNRADRGRSRKVYRIKNPFQRQLDLGDDIHQQDSTTTQDSAAGASNQYPSMQYSLPPEEFLQQMRAEQYYQQQQQQQQQQVSTPSPNMGYTATPQPQYQYSTMAPSAFESNQQSNQIPQLESKISGPQSYRSISNSYQYNGPNSYAIDTVQSTPSPLAYLSTPSPLSPYVGTPTNTYVSSSSPIFLSSSPNLQQYVSSSISAIQAGTPDYNNKVSTTIGSNSINYDNSDPIKKMQIDHYDNSVIGMRYPINFQQYQYDFPSSTVAPSSTPYPDAMRESWQNGVNSVSKSLQDVSLSPYQKYQYNKNQDSRQEQNSEISNGETNRFSNNVPSANNLYFNYVQPDYQALSNMRTRSRDVEHETGQPEYYSHGEYGWKLTDKKPLVSQGSQGYSSGSYPRYQGMRSQSQNDGVAVSQMSFHMDTSKPQQQHNYDHISKSSPETTDGQEFAKAAARAHEELKQRQQLYGNDYASSYSNSPYSGFTGNSYYGHNDNKQRSKYFSDNPNAYYFIGGQQDLITASPYYYASSRENPEEKPKQPFDHDKALKNIVSIDVSNVLANSENQQKIPSNSDNGKYNQHTFGKEQVEQNLKQSFKSITDSFYQDKNAVYGLNIKPKPDEGISSDGLKLLESTYYGKQPTQEPFYNPGSYSDNKRYIDAASQSANYLSQVNYQDNAQSPANTQPQGIQRPQNQHPSDIASILKLNDIPYRLTQGLPLESFRSHSGNYEPVGLPTPLPPRINQNVGSHQLDVAGNILNKLILNKLPHGSNRPDIDSQSGSISTINGFKVANPFNVDLKLVADMLKGKPSMDESQILGLRDQFNKPPPLKIDISQLQQLLQKNENPRSLSFLNDGLGAYSSPYFEIYNSGGYPYQGVKYSRSQEEEESIVPIADSSNAHPIGAVIEQDDSANSREVVSGSDLTGKDEETVTDVTEDRPKNKFIPNQRGIRDRHRHPNSLLFNRHSYQRKYPKGDVHEPYPLLKPPPQLSRNRGSIGSHLNEKYSRKRRVRRPKMVRVMKSEPLYEAESDDDSESHVLTLLQPPSPVAEAKSDKEVVDNEESS